MNEIISTSTSLSITLPKYPAIRLLVDSLCALLVRLPITWLTGYDIARVEVESVEVQWKNTNFTILLEPFEV